MYYRALLMGYLILALTLLFSCIVPKDSTNEESNDNSTETEATEEEESSTSATTGTTSSTISSSISSLEPSAVNTIASNPLALAFPSSLALTAFPKASTVNLVKLVQGENPPPIPKDDDETPALDNNNQSNPPVHDNDPPVVKDAEDAASDLFDKKDENKTMKEKIIETELILKGEASSCLDVNIFGDGPDTMNEEKCYNFDSDMNLSRFTGDNYSDTSFDWGTADGNNSEGEACMVAFARIQIQDAVNTVDKALSIGRGLLCQAKKSGLSDDLPDEGSTLDLTSSFQKAVGSDTTVNLASISRLSDLAGRKVYRTDVKIVDSHGRKLETHILHSPGDDEDNYSGTLWFQSENQGQQGPAMDHDPNNSGNKNNVMSVNYEKSITDGVPNMRFEVRRASIVDSVDPFTSEGLVNYVAVSKNAGNSDIHAISYVAFDGNPETSEGNLSYWMNPGGNYQESARGFLFNVEADEATGVLKGCGTSGSTNELSIRKAVTEPSDDNTLQPEMYWHPRGNQNDHPNKDPRYEDNEGNLITKQCFKQSSTGVYEVDKDVTTHSRGYDVIATKNAGVKPPKMPEEILEGEFLPE